MPRRNNALGVRRSTDGAPPGIHTLDEPSAFALRWQKTFANAKRKAIDELRDQGIPVIDTEGD